MARAASVGWLLPEPKSFAFEPLRRKLRELGWTETGDLVIEERYSHGVGSHFAPLASELVRLRVDVLVTDGFAATAAAQRATATIPIVFVSGNPLACSSPLLGEFARPLVSGARIPV